MIVACRYITKLVAAMLLCIFLCILSSCSSKPESVSNTSTSQGERKFEFVPSKNNIHPTDSARRERRGIPLVEVASESGLRHTYYNGAEGNYLMVEAMGAGWAWIDYDGDWYPDAFLNQRLNRIHVGMDGVKLLLLFVNLNDDF